MKTIPKKSKVRSRSNHKDDLESIAGPSKSTRSKGKVEIEYEMEMEMEKI